MWHTIHEAASGAFAPVDLTLHLGGQLFPDDSMFAREALLLLHDPADDDNDGSAAVLDRLRDLVRTKWALPDVRATLAHGAHVMLGNGNDAFGVQSGSVAEARVRDHVAAVHSEYIELLWPPLKRQQQQQHQQNVPTSRSRSHVWGHFGLFFLHVETDLAALERGRCIGAECWRRLQAFLRLPQLRSLVVVTPDCLVEDSVEDTVQKVREVCVSVRKRRESN